MRIALLLPQDTLDKIHLVGQAHESVRLFRTPAYAKFEDLSTRVADRGRMTGYCGDQDTRRCENSASAKRP